MRIFDRGLGVVLVTGLVLASAGCRRDDEQRARAIEAQRRAEHELTSARLEAEESVARAKREANEAAQRVERERGEARRPAYDDFAGCADSRGTLQA